MLFPHIFRSLFFLIALGACTKDQQPVSFEVLERGSNKPVAGVLIDLSRCTAYLPDGKCRTVEIFESATTDASGKATVKQASYEKANEGFEFSKDGYLKIRANTTNVSMDKFGTVNLKLVPQSASPLFSRIIIYACNDRFCYRATDSFDRPLTPVLMTVKAFEGQVNTIKWEESVSSLIGGGAPMIINRGEVPNITVPYSGAITINL
jgi:hypothetical protein